MRQIAVPRKIRLDRLHEVAQAAMGGAETLHGLRRRGLVYCCLNHQPRKDGEVGNDPSGGVIRGRAGGAASDMYRHGWGAPDPGILSQTEGRRHQAVAAWRSNSVLARAQTP